MLCCRVYIDILENNWRSGTVEKAYIFWLFSDYIGGFCPKSCHKLLEL